MCPALERRAEILHDHGFGPPFSVSTKNEGQGTGAGKGAGAGVAKAGWQERFCTFCNKQGHTVEFRWGKARGKGNNGQKAGGKGAGKKGAQTVCFILI